MKQMTGQANADFYPRSPCGERPCPFLQSECPFAISIHALLAESDKIDKIFNLATRHFYPRSPCGERLHNRVALIPHQQNFYPRSPCGERLIDNVYSLQYDVISIHALLAESDSQGDLFQCPGTISIHALLAESDLLEL